MRFGWLLKVYFEGGQVMLVQQIMFYIFNLEKQFSK